ncbi:P-loop containing nucleoside triphosphate hydrolase protein, partial [Mycena galericulata]
TTRGIRTDSKGNKEIHGKDYFFVETSQFKDMIAKDQFIEYAQYSGNFYGTSFETVKKAQEKISVASSTSSLRVCARSSAPTETHLPFHLSSSMSALESRLRERGTGESEESILKRLKTAITEIQYAKKPNAHHFIIVNDNLDRAYEIFKQVALGHKKGERIPDFGLSEDHVLFDDRAKADADDGVFKQVEDDKDIETLPPLDD